MEAPAAGYPLDPSASVGMTVGVFLEDYRTKQVIENT